MKSVRDTLNYAIGSGIYSNMWNNKTENISALLRGYISDNTWFELNYCINEAICDPISNDYEFQ